MFKNILVPLTGFENDAKALEAGFVTGWPFDAVIEALHVQPEPIEIVMAAALRQFGSKMGNRELIHALEKEAASRTHSAKTAFDEFFKRHFSAHAFASAASGVTASWRCEEGHPVEDTLSAARFSDLLVLGRAPEHGQFALDSVANILVGCGRPVLLVPNAEIGPIGHTIAIAWKEKAEAARAVTAAMPLLVRAKKVLVLSANEEGSDPGPSRESAERLRSHLARHGMSVEAYGLTAHPQSVPHALLHKAKELGCDLVVAGAYSHSRVRELVFGGFTRAVLQDCDLPLMLLH
jgi:nucleotide-binding universal stress UspA family protein